MRGDDDFFSVARTIPFVAIHNQSWDGIQRLAYHFEAVPLIPKAVTP